MKYQSVFLFFIMGHVPTAKLRKLLNITTKALMNKISEIIQVPTYKPIQEGLYKL